MNDLFGEPQIVPTLDMGQQLAEQVMLCERVSPSRVEILAYGYDNQQVENVRDFFIDMGSSVYLHQGFADRGVVPPLYSYMMKINVLDDFFKWLVDTGRELPL